MPSFNSVISMNPSALRWLVRPVVRWAVRHGLDYTQCVRLMKPLFLHEAQALLQEQSRKSTDSALVLTSGLHRMDIQRIKDEGDWPDSQAEVSISLPQQVLANWVMSGLPQSIPFKTSKSEMGLTEEGESKEVVSFCDLIRLTPKVAAQGLSARLLLQDMCLKGTVTVARGMVTLEPMGQHQSTPESEQGLQDLSAALNDLMASGLHNLHSEPDLRFLEQSILANGLWPESVQRLHDQAQDAWQKTVSALLPEAKAASDHDEPQGGHMRIRVGTYFYAEQMPKIGHAVDSTNDVSSLSSM